MSSKESITKAIHSQPLTQLDTILLCLDVDGERFSSPKEIKDFALAIGVKAKKWNISGVLSRDRKFTIHFPDSWELTEMGKQRAGRLNPFSATAKTAHDLRNQLISVKSDNAKAFLDESIRCLESNCLRASVVFSWIGAVATLYEEVLANHLSAFNLEAAKRNQKWKAATTFDDLAKMKESEFLDVICAISILGKSVKQELEACLKLRNGCGHPNSLSLGELRVRSHIETLTNNVFKKF